MTEADQGHVKSEKTRQEELDKIFTKWRRALGLPKSFPQPRQKELPSVNEAIAGSEHGRHDFSYYHEKDIDYKGLASLFDADQISIHYSGHSFITIPRGQGASTFAETADAAHALSVSNRIPVLIKEDILDEQSAGSHQELKNRILGEVLKRAVLAGREKRVSEDNEFGGKTWVGHELNRELEEKGVINEKYEVDLDRALEYFGSVEKIFEEIDELKSGFTLRVDFSSPLSLTDPVTYGLRVGRLFSAAEEVLNDLRGDPDSRFRQSYLQGIGPKEALDAISEVSDVEFGTLDDQDEAEMSIFEAWAMLLNSYPEHRDTISMYVHSGLLGKAADPSWYDHSIEAIFERFERNLKEHLERDNSTLHLGFGDR